MNLQFTKLLTGSDVAVLSLFTALSAWVYIGFLFPGSFMLSYGSIPRVILWFLCIFLPLLYISAMILYGSMRLHTVSRGGGIYTSLCCYVNRLVC